jgi:uncharacterized protein
MRDTVQITPFEILLGGAAIEENEIASWVVEQDVNQPDMCVLTLHNPEHTHSNRIKLADALEIDVGDEAVRLFSGEVVGLEPMYKASGESLCVVRAFNRLHRLLRGRHSRTYVEQTDSQIAEKIASENGLSCESTSTSTSYEHVYQHNQTDFEFLRGRAARIGFEVRVEDRTLRFSKPRRDEDSGLELRMNDAAAAGTLLSFMPRLSSAGLVNTVEVRAWDPVKKEEIVGTYEGARSPLGKRSGSDEAKAAFGTIATYQVDDPVASVAEAKAIAEARYHELAMDFITGDAVCLGDPQLQIDKVVTIVVNPDDDRERFNGKYRITGATHRYAHAGPGGGGAGGYTTSLRVRRDAEGT